MRITVKSAKSARKTSRFLGRLFALWVPILFCCVSGAGHAQTLHEACLPLTPEVSARLASYIAKAYDFAPDIRVNDDGMLGSTCFRQITFDVASPKRSLSFYLSPDQQYLTEQLVDVRLDPSAEKLRVGMDTQRKFLRGKSPSKGAADALVTVVEFSDFQCPFCKAFAGFIDQGTWNSSDVKVVFKQLPLSIHPWAARAAVLTSCVAEQSGPSFWKLHDFLFRMQESLTQENFAAETAHYLAGDPALDRKTLNTCVESGLTVQLNDDSSLAREYQINATPTIFINGIRQTGFHSKEELSAAIQKALEAAKRSRQPAEVPVASPSGSK